MQAKSKRAVAFIGAVAGILLYAGALAAGAVVAVLFVDGLVRQTELPVVDVVAVLAVILYGMKVADMVLVKGMRWGTERLLARMQERLARSLPPEHRMGDEHDLHQVERVPFWMERPPCEGTYLVQHPDGQVEHGVVVKRYLPRKGLWAITLAGLVEVDALVEDGFKFDGPLSRSQAA